MFNRLINMAFGAVVGHFLKSKIRNGSIQAVKAYIQAIKYARLGLMGIIALNVACALLVAGVILIIEGIIGLLPIEASTMAITTLVIGVLLTAAIGIGFAMALSQKRWLKMSKSYELMDAVLAPWPGVMPPNPVDVVKGQAHLSRNVPDATVPEFVRTHQPREVSDRDLAMATPLG